jgi:hypothetical protein
LGNYLLFWKTRTIRSLGITVVPSHELSIASPPP